ncbi:hypothetical protein CDAR_169301 [Caerostris darwini]|uniref:Uncharacterized protein n=1 Tax=Caerostris darwini TaxID=1538125 RepID=A0AAV4QHQ0_9ARAC|nr:hypothetical protein CDAR_169301 [Caerostris darwini]
MNFNPVFRCINKCQLLVVTKNSIKKTADKWQSKREAKVLGDECHIPSKGLMEGRVPLTQFRLWPFTEISLGRTLGEVNEVINTRSRKGHHHGLTTESASVSKMVFRNAFVSTLKTDEDSENE